MRRFLRNGVIPCRQDREALVLLLKEHGAKFRGNACTCPWHEDKSPSAGVYRDDSGIWRFRCHAGSCGVSGDYFDLLARIEGRNLRDVLREERQAEAPPRMLTAAKPRQQTVFNGLAALEKHYVRYGATHEKTFVYTDATGAPVMAAIRLREGDSKSFRLARCEAGKWYSAAPPKPRILYRLPGVIASEKVVIVEGEKCADALADLGFVATTAPAGAGKGAHANWTPLSEKRVVLWPDHDDPGRAHMLDVARILRALDTPPVSLKWIDPASLNLDAKGDAADFVARFDSSDAARAAVQEILDSAGEAPTESEGEGTPEIEQGNESKSPEWPEPIPLPSLPPVERFDTALLPEPLRPWIEDLCAREPYPVEYLAVGALVAAGALIGRQCAVAPRGGSSDWIEVPNIWGCCVGRPSWMKTPAMQAVLAPLQALESEAARVNEEILREHAGARIEYEERVKAIKGDVKAALASGDNRAVARLRESLPSEPGPPPCRRYIVNDSSIEALGEVMQVNPRGVLLYRDELSGLLDSCERDYMRGARQFYLEAWTGTGNYTFDRVSRGTTRIEGACLSVLGGIQPDILERVIAEGRKGGGDGLLPRFGLLVYPDPPSGEWGDGSAPGMEAHETAANALHALDELDPARLGAVEHRTHKIPVLPFDADARTLFKKWHDEHLLPKVRAAAPTPLIEAALSKYKSLVPSLALIDHLLDRRGGPVPARSVEKGIAISLWAESHLHRVMGGRWEQANAARSLLARIESGDLPVPFRERDIRRKCWGGLDAESIPGALAMLEEYGHLRSRPAETGGRPTTDYCPRPGKGGAA